MMLSFQDILNAASVASALAVVVTLLFLIWQTRILQEQTQCAVDSSRAQNHAILREEMLKINEVFLQHPEIRKYFYEGVPINTNDELYPRAEAAAEMLLDIMEHMLGQASLFPRLYHLSPDEEAFWNSWDTYIVDMLVSSPLLLAYLQKKTEWYSSQLVERMKRAQFKLSHRNAVPASPVVSDNP